MRPHFNGRKLGVVMHACHPSYGRKHKIGRSQSKLAWAKNMILSKRIEQLGAGGSHL
jgi:hypothetical protein